MHLRARVSNAGEAVSNACAHVCNAACVRLHMYTCACMYMMSTCMQLVTPHTLLMGDGLRFEMKKHQALKSFAGVSVTLIFCQIQRGKANGNGKRSIIEIDS